VPFPDREGMVSKPFLECANAAAEDTLRSFSWRKNKKERPWALL